MHDIWRGVVWVVWYGSRQQLNGLDGLLLCAGGGVWVFDLASKKKRITPRSTEIIYMRGDSVVTA